MSFPPKTRNFQLQNLTQNENVLFTLTIKQKVKVLRTEGAISVLTESDQELGVLDITSLEDYHPNVEFEGFVRSIVRGLDQSISSVFVSLTPRKRPQDPQWVPRWEAETQQEGWLLKQQHYEALGEILFFALKTGFSPVANERIRTQLENPKLQRILKSVDSAENRETVFFN